MIEAETPATDSREPRLQFSVPCLNVVDEAGKPPSFEYLFYELPLRDLPAAVSFYIATGWAGGLGAHRQSVEIVNPDGTALVHTGDQPFSLSSRDIPFMAVNFFKDIGFTQPGRHRVRCLLNGVPVLEYPLSIRLLVVAHPPIRIQPPEEGARIRRFPINQVGQ